MKYNAFISYSHADRELPKAIQAGLRLLANPWFKLEALKVFRDVSNLSASPELWPDIEKALSESEFFILLASPEAAQSKWVRKEVDYWIKNKPKGTLLLAQVNGVIVWNEATSDFDLEKSTSIPANLTGYFLHEPNYANFLKFHNSKDATLDNQDFQEEIAKLAAPLHKKSVGELIGKQEHEYKRKIYTRNTVILALSILLVVVVSLAFLFNEQKKQARRELRANQLAVQALQTQRINPTAAVAKLLEAFKISNDSSIYELANNIYGSNYTYERNITVEKDLFVDISSGGLIAVSKDYRFIIYRGNDTLSGNLRALLGNNEIAKVEINAAGDFFIIKPKNSKHLYVIGSLDNTIKKLAGVAATFAKASNDLVCLTEKGELLTYSYKASYASTNRRIKIVDEELIKNISITADPLIKLNADNSFAAISHINLSVVSMNTGEKRTDIRRFPSGPYSSFSISKTGKYVALDSGFTISIYKEGNLQKTIKGHANYISSLEFSPSADNILVSTSMDMTGVLHNIDNDERHVLLAHLTTPFARFSSDGSSFVTYDTNQIYVWPLINVPQRVLMESSGEFNTVKISPDNKYIAAADMIGRLFLWTSNGSLLLSNFLISDQFMKERIAFDKEGNVLYVVSKEKNSILSYGMKDKKFRSFAPTKDTIMGIVNSDLNDIYGFTTSGRLLKWNKDGELLFSKVIDTGYINFTSIKTRGDKLLASTDEGEIILLSLDGAVIKKFMFDSEGTNTQSADVSTDFNYYAVTGNNNLIKIFNKNFELLRSIPFRAGYGMDVKFLSSSNAFVTAGDDQKVKIWDVMQHEVASYTASANSIIYSFDISSDNQFMVTASDKALELWRLKRQLKTLR